MSYKALYRSYRPKSFDDVVGQDHIVQTLKNILKMSKISHAYLFAGPRGTGKTSVAHIFANVLNCSDVLSSIEVCGKCEQCLTKVNMDIIEIDAASNNGVGEIRKLINDSKYAPSISKYKIYIVDEVHMLSKGAFNALLKTLEEPPKHVIFILATTEPFKIPITILSRTQRFNFKRIASEAISDRLKFVLDKENIIYDDESIETLARLSNGGMRDALSMADQVSAFANQNISLKAISTIFGIVSTPKIIEFLNKIYGLHTKDVLILSNSFLSNGTNITKFIENILEVIKDFVVFKKTNDVNLLTNLNSEKVKTIDISLPFAYKALNEFGELLTKLRFSEYPSQTFELSLLKLLENSVAVEDEVQKMDNVPTKNITSTEAETINDPSENTDEINIFDTNEIMIKNKLEQEDLTSEIQIADNELEDESHLIEEEILNTQEINLQNMTKEIESTDEIDVVKMFQLDEQNLENEVVNVSEGLALEEVINLLVLTNKSEVAKIKNKWVNINNYLSDDKFNNIATLLQNTKIITANESFILVTSQDDLIIREINDVSKSDVFHELVNAIFGELYHVFAITRKEFEKVKEEYKQASESKSLPLPKEMEKPILEKEENKAESFGAEIFGDIFDS